MKPKTAQLQIRVTAHEKNAIQRLARQAGMGMSAYVLGRVLSVPSTRFSDLVAACNDSGSAGFGLAELNSFLASLSGPELKDAVARAPALKSTPFVGNYVAAMVEYACQKRDVPVPGWVRDIEPLAEPAFASGLLGIRLHLLTHSPPPFRRRNIFIDSSIGDRV